MKKILLFSLFILSSIAMTSCTADSISDSVPSQTVHADESIGGQNGQPTPPKP